jgi:hypothetical protein
LANHSALDSRRVDNHEENKQNGKRGSSSFAEVSAGHR